VGVLWDARLRQALEPSFKAMQTALPSLGLQHYAIAVNGPDDLPDAFRAASRARVEALILFPSPTFFDHLAEFARMTAEQKIPAISGFCRLRSGRGFFVVRSERRENLAVCRDIRRQDSQGHESGRNSGRAVGQYRSRRQPSDREGARADRAASTFGVGERGHRLRARTACRRSAAPRRL
jgi:hypothetical protein